VHFPLQILAFGCPGRFIPRFKEHTTKHELINPFYLGNARLTCPRALLRTDQEIKVFPHIAMTSRINYGVDYPNPVWADRMKFRILFFQGRRHCSNAITIDKTKA
jgi:hypothetical protein